VTNPELRFYNSQSKGGEANDIIGTDSDKTVDSPISERSQLVSAPAQCYSKIPLAVLKQLLQPV
jgi:hypothetical protein